MRKFYLENESGKRLDLNSKTEMFLASPKGLGAEFDTEYSDSINGFFINSKYAHDMSSIKGTLLFITDPYTLFKTFSDFVHGASTLYFLYAPSDDYLYYKRVKIEEIDKSELSKTGVLSASVTFEALTPWYTPTPVDIAWGGENSTRFRFGSMKKSGSTIVISGGTSLDGTARLASDIANDFEVLVQKSPQMESALKLTINGKIVNPKVSLVGEATGTTYGSLTFTDKTVASGESIVMCSDYLNSYVSSVDSSGNETDIISSLDLTENFFFRIPTTERCRIKITCDSFSKATASAELYYYYRSV